MPTIPYLHFQGRCAEALAFYAEVFGGTDLQVMRYGEAPDAPEAHRGSSLVQHGQVSLGDGTLMASDFPPGMAGDPQAGFSVMQTLPDAASAQAAFDRLAGEGGVVVIAMQATFFSAAFGMAKDRFGTHWIVSAMPAAAPAG